MTKSTQEGSEVGCFHGVRAYQDVVVDGEKICHGRRDCSERWAILDPYLPPAGTFLDIGSNLGWFGLKICQTRPEAVVASVEADERLADAQRAVLEANGSQRICLLTARAGRVLAGRFAAAGQRFDAVLCLSVLHWIADHRAMMRELGRLARRVLVEHPDANEAGAGIDWIRRDIGPIGPYLTALFPDRPVRRVGELPSHRGPNPRQLWLVAEPEGWPAEPSPGLDLGALLACAPGWPPRSWWQRQWPTAGGDNSSPALLTAHGLTLAHGPVDDAAERRLLRAMRRLPEHRAVPLARHWYRRLRRGAGNLLRRLRRRGS